MRTAHRSKSARFRLIDKCGGAQASLRLGVVWYRTLDEAHNADGKHIAYLQPGHRPAAGLGQLAPDLYQRLADMVASGHRSTAALADARPLLAAEPRCEPGSAAHRDADVA